MYSREGQEPYGSHARWLRDGVAPIIAGGESNPGESPLTAQPAKPADPPAPEPKGDEHDPARAKALIDKLRDEVKEAKALKAERDALKAKVDQHEAAALSETEKQAKKIADLEASVARHAAERRDLLIRAEVERQARKLGVVDEAVAYKLLDLGALEFDADGNPTGVEKALKALLELHPFLKAAESGRAGVPATPRPNGNPTADKIEENRQKLRATGSYTRF